MKIPFRRDHAKVVYSSTYIYNVLSAGDQHVFDLMKYKKIFDKLTREKILRRYHLLRPDACTYDDLRLVHTDSYLKSLQDTQVVENILKVKIGELLFDSVLEYYCAVTGGTLLATAYALRWIKPVFNLGGGFHHAHPDKGEGFCLINDVAIAIEKFRRLSRARKYMIIDLDYHQGNGNLLYFKDDCDVYTFSMHGDTWVEIDRPYNKDILVSKECGDEEYLTLLEEELDESCHSFKPDAVFFIAGSDTYEKDIIGDMQLSREGMLSRNLMVYRKVKKANLPLIILAGGGYGPDSWETYYDFIAYCLSNKH
jgi:acetoin utilization deacetylase AcuC-like enzyme